MFAAAPNAPGHYMVHLRAVLQNTSTSVTRRAAYEGKLTYLVVQQPECPIAEPELELLKA